VTEPAVAGGRRRLSMAGPRPLQRRYGGGTAAVRLQIVGGTAANAFPAGYFKVRPLSISNRMQRRKFRALMD